MIEHERGIDRRKRDREYKSDDTQNARKIRLQKADIVVIVGLKALLKQKRRCERYRTAVHDKDTPTLQHTGSGNVRSFGRAECRKRRPAVVAYALGKIVGVEHAVDIDSHELISSIERVSLIVSEKLKNPVRFHFDGNYVQLSCVTAIGKSYDECPIDGCIEDLEIGFNNRYMLDALRASGTEKVRLQLKGSLNPIVISPTEGDKFTYLVLPVRLRAND